MRCDKYQYYLQRWVQNEYSMLVVLRCKNSNIIVEYYKLHPQDKLTLDHLIYQLDLGFL